MTRKDYVAIAGVLRAESKNSDNDADIECIGRIAEVLSAKFADGNDSFDRERFLRACGLE